jgi:hypothetical protein
MHLQFRAVSWPELFLVAGTRGMLGFGAGLLASQYLTRQKRRQVGIPLLAIGVLSTLPILLHLLRKPVVEAPERHNATPGEAEFERSRGLRGVTP